MPWILNQGPTGPRQYYTLPVGLTGVGTLGQVVAFLLDSYNFPTTDPGLTGAVWNNNSNPAVSSGS